MDINYFKHDGIAGDYFSCPKGLGTYSTDFCARMYTEAMPSTTSAMSFRNGRRAACMSCPIGAKHAGVANHSVPRFFGRLLCSRCQSLTTRLIRSAICVSCYNREREVLIGKNAKGSPPIFCKPVDAIYVSCAIDAGEVTQVRNMTKVTSLMEAYLSILRATPEAIWFGMVNLTPSCEVEC